MNTWKNVPLGDFCATGSGSTPSRSKYERYFNGSIPWVKSGELRENEIHTTEEMVTVAAINETSVKLIPAGAILVAMYGATVGRTAILKVEATSNQAICHVIPDPQVADRNYVYRAIRWKVPELLNRAAGGAQPNISQGVIKTTTIPIPHKNDGSPDLAEQKRIATILDKADAIRRKRQEAIRLTDELLQSTFLEMFGDPVTNPKGWDWGCIGDLAEHVNYGSSKKAGATGEYPILRMGNITYSGGWSFDDLKYIDFDDKEKSKYLVNKGQILFNRTNSKELVGKTAVYREEKPMAFAGYLVRLTTNERANPEYIAAFMNTPQTKTFLREKCKNIVGMANINAKEFQAITIPIPPIKMQNQFAVLVNKILMFGKAQSRYYSESNELFNSLMQKAFRGEL